MKDATPHTVQLSVRLPRPMAAAIQQVADREANTPSAVARRLIAAGLERERPRDTSGEETDR